MVGRHNKSFWYIKVCMLLAILGSVLIFSGCEEPHGTRVATRVLQPVSARRQEQAELFATIDPRQARLDTLADEIKHRFGKAALHRASGIRRNTDYKLTAAAILQMKTAGPIFRSGLLVESAW